MAHQSNGHLDSWTLQLNATLLKLALGKQTKYPNNIIIKHKYSSDFLTKLAKNKYLRKDFVHKFQDVMGINYFPQHFEMLMKNIILKFHFRLPSHINTTIMYLILVPFVYLFGLPKNYIRKVEFSCKFQLPRSKNHHPIQGRTQDVFPGGGGARLSTILDGKRKRGRAAPERGEGVGGGTPPLPHEGAFAFLRLKLNDLVHTLGRFF